MNLLIYVFTHLVMVACLMNVLYMSAGEKIFVKHQ